MRNNYKIANEFRDDTGHVNGLQMLFDVGDLRSQLIYLWEHNLNGGTEPWFTIASPFARASNVDVVGVLESVGANVCGGVAKVGDLLVLKHAVPLATLDILEFERPLMLVVHTADALEEKFAGGDSF
ncbi:hypothetical protein [Pedococcus dokdonensis]|uniref:hypothetical protein n=1 Tax=Pedococcus dokdonensis TaxID=443156 RepID=UPI0012FD81FE|nr:hypothetical protein [Pedococcus dokdonensis]